MSDPVLFSKLTEDQHRRVDRERWNDIIVVGDVHGCLLELQELLDQLDPSGNDLLVFTGDLIRKGPRSNEVLNFLRSREHLISVRGNNEQKIIDGRADMADLTPENRQYIQSLPVLISWNRSIVVHGGVDPRKRLRDQTPGELLTYRSVDGNGYDGRLWFEEYDRSVRVFFGHTVLSEPLVHDAFVGLDTGCVYGGTLSAYVTDLDELVRIDSGRTVVERDEAYIISTQDVDRDV